MQIASREGYGFLGAKGDAVPMRNAALKAQTKAVEEQFALPEEILRAKANQHTPDMHARFPSTAYLMWLNRYDATQVAREHLAKLS